MSEIASLIYNVYLDVAAHTHGSMKLILAGDRLACCWDVKQPTNDSPEIHFAGMYIKWPTPRQGSCLTATLPANISVMWGGTVGCVSGERAAVGRRERQCDPGGAAGAGDVGPGLRQVVLQGDYLCRSMCLWPCVLTCVGGLVCLSVCLSLCLWFSKVVACEGVSLVLCP